MSDAHQTREYVHCTDENGARVGLFPAPAFECSVKDVNARRDNDALIEKGVRSAACITPYRSATPLTLAQPPDLGVHLHLHFLDLLDEMSLCLSRVPFPFCLYVSITDSNSLQRVQQRLARQIPRARITVREVVNRGRDLGPMVTEFAGDLAGHEYIGHVHSKRSAHSNWKSDWRRQLLACLLGSEDTVRYIFQRFEEDPGLGMVFPVYHHSLQKQISWGKNFAVCESLAAQLGLSIEAGRMVLFPAGSMFWARSSALQSLLGAGLSQDTFPTETGQLDGTPAHALERLFGELVADQGGRLMQVRNERPYTDRCFNPPGRWSLPRWLNRR